jgi:hypothetical protein
VGLLALCDAMILELLLLLNTIPPGVFAIGPVEKTVVPGEFLTDDVSRALSKRVLIAVGF